MDPQDLGAELIRIGSTLRLGHSLQDAGIRDEVAWNLLLAAITPGRILQTKYTEDRENYRDAEGFNVGEVAFNQKLVVTLWPTPPPN